jgi:hypothetical protein
VATHFVSLFASRWIRCAVLVLVLHVLVLQNLSSRPLAQPDRESFRVALFEPDLAAPNETFTIAPSPERKQEEEKVKPSAPSLLQERKPGDPNPFQVLEKDRDPELELKLNLPVASTAIPPVVGVIENPPSIKIVQSTTTAEPVRDGSYRVWHFGHILGDDKKNSERFSSLKPDGIENVRAISGGSWFAAFLLRDDSIVLRDSSRSKVIKIDGLANFRSVASSDSSYIALGEDGSMYGWGPNYNFQLGALVENSRIWDSRTPVRVLKGLEGVIQISDGGRGFIFLKSDGTVWSIGNNEFGQLGIGSTASKVSPVQIQDLKNVKWISSYWDRRFAVTADGSVYSWGGTSLLGYKSYYPVLSPRKIEELSGVVRIAAGGNQILALKQDGTVWAWGWNRNGSVGDGTTTRRETPVKVLSLTDIVAIATGDSHSLALKNDGTLWAWGSNRFGQAGLDNTTGDQIKPRQIPELTRIVSIASSSCQSMALQWIGGEGKPARKPSIARPEPLITVPDPLDSEHGNEF